VRSPWARQHQATFISVDAELAAVLVPPPCIGRQTEDRRVDAGVATVVARQPDAARHPRDRVADAEGGLDGAVDDAHRDEVERGRAREHAEAPARDRLERRHEAGEPAVVAHDGLAVDVVSREREPLARQSQIRLEVALEHGRERRGLQHVATVDLAGRAHPRNEAQHVVDRRVQGTGRRDDDVLQRHLGRAVAFDVPALGQARSQLVGEQDVARVHLERVEDPLLDVALVRRAGHVLDELTE